MPQSNDAKTMASRAPYRPAPGGRSPDDWVVASGTPDNLGPAILSGFKTEKVAQEAADTLNGLELDEGRRDAVLRRMLGVDTGA